MRVREWILASVSWLIISQNPANAVPQTITDSFIGGRPNYVAGPGTIVPGNYLDTIRNTYQNNDVIGNPAQFDVDSMTVEFSGSNILSVVIHTNFVDNIGLRGVGLGDLFISDGWNPTADTRNDFAGTGTDWQTVVHLDNRYANSGSLNVYDIIDSNVVLSWAQTPAPGNVAVYRGEQEVAYNAGQQLSMGSGSWAIDTVANTLTLNIAFNQNFSDIGGTVWGFHWGMTCGNDIIEGAASTSVPEPSTIALLLAGVCGGFSLRRRTAR